MVIDITKHNASILSTGENTIACNNITEAFLDVFSVDYGKDFAIIKQAHRYINNNPVIKVDVVLNEHLYKDVEFILVKSNEQGIFINENSLANGIIIEHHEIEVAPEETCVTEHYAHEIDAALDSAVVEKIVPEIDVADLKQQARAQQQNKILQQLQTIQEELSDQVQFELQQTKQSLVEETLAIQNKIQNDSSQLVQQSVENFRIQLKQWANDAQQHLTEYAEEAIADAELQLMENSKQLLQLNKQQTLDELQHEISAATINSMAAIKESLNAEIAAHLRTFDERQQQTNGAVELFIQEQIKQLHEQIEESQMHKFDAKVAELLIKQHEWLQQNINETTDAYDAKFGAMHDQLHKAVAETSNDVASCIKNADATIEAKINAALQQLNERAHELHQERMQTIEQSVADVLKENLADDQTDVISEARASARNAVKNALASYKTDMSKELNAQLMNIQKELHNKLQLYTQSYAGGGSIATQYADGGIMNGTLNVASGQILSAGTDLATIFASSNGATNNYLPLTGGTVNGDVVVTGTLSATTFYATSAFITVVDVTQYELSGFNVTGNVTVNGQMSASTVATNFIDFTPLTAAPIHVDGRLYYDQEEQTLVFWDGDPTLKYPINKMLWNIGVNKTGSTIPKGTVVYLSGAQGNRGKMWPAIATTDLRSADTIGVTMQSTAINQEGYIMAIGELEGIDTRAFAEGTTLYLSPTAAGGITSIKPQAPNHAVKIGFSLNSTVNGKIYVEIDNGYKLDELHNVLINNVNNGQGITYNSASAVWVNSDLYNGSDLKSLSANWQNTYSSFATQSANNASVYSSVASNSANWQQSYTTLNTLTSAVSVTNSGNIAFAGTQTTTLSTTSLFGITCSTDDNLTLSGHNLVDGDVLMYVSGSGGFSVFAHSYASTGGLAYYYVVQATQNTFKLSTTPGGAAVDITSSGTNGVFEVARSGITINTQTSATSATTYRNPSTISLGGSYWTGSTSANYSLRLRSAWNTTYNIPIFRVESNNAEVMSIYCGTYPLINLGTGAGGVTIRTAYPGNSFYFDAFRTYVGSYYRIGTIYDTLPGYTAAGDNGSYLIGISTASNSTTRTNANFIGFGREASGVIRWGIDNATTPTDQTIKAHNVTTGTGASLTLAGGKGSTAGGALYLSTSPTSGDAVNRISILANGTTTIGASASSILLCDNSNISFFTSSSNYGGGSKIMFISNATAAPSANPVAGGYMFVSAGALKYMGSSGTITTLAPA